MTRVYNILIVARICDWNYLYVQVYRLRINVFRALLQKKMAFFDERGSARLTHLLIVGARDVKDAIGDKLPIVVMSSGMKWMASKKK